MMSILLNILFWTILYSTILILVYRTGYRKGYWQRDDEWREWVNDNGPFYQIVQEGSDKEFLTNWDDALPSSEFNSSSRSYEQEQKCRVKAIKGNVIKVNFN